MTEDDQDAVFHALASQSRRRMLDLIKAAPGCAVSDVVRHFDVSRVAVMKHLAVLEAANLIVSKKCGRVRQLHINAVPIQMIHERWTTEFSAHWAGRLTGLKYRMESRK
ncbi:helix-turn-helix transcriptional regulator [uncultured Abyssibacter sp.]|uniref:ArsR/SmtB family transcription factor n=1 Tax=uncultured Abyssibacter sp. TaxID=2320202 RepID=UPI0032B2C0E2|tara:strand:- start:312 stop:638 length:327 start_codon:yes stop_codon:yes gene_type:complete